jgi:DNA-binding NarL/FixJ family response regulator
MAEGVLVAVDDLFFLAKIEAVAKQAGIGIVEARSARSLEERLREAPPRLVILDLNSAACAPLEAIRGIKSDPRLAGTRVVGFLSHVQADLGRAAEAAGCDLVLPRSVFSARLADILKTSGA